MIWSFSSSRMFRRCQREWYFRTFVASPTKKDPLRREAYLLSKLQSIAAWRGNLVDYVISRRVVPYLNNNWSLNPPRILEYARTAFEKQLEFAMQHRLREPSMIPSQAGDIFAAFHAIEYGMEVSEDEIGQAWSEVEKALTNLLEMHEFLTLLSTANDLLPQRALIFPHYQVSVRAVPDLIAFFDNAPPLLADWKVHAFGVHDYRLQLACYAVALTKCKPHKDFPPSLSLYTATDIRLLEVQLLTNQQREYTLTNSDVENVDTYIFETAMQMILAQGNDAHEQLRPFDFPVTNYPEVCQRCIFRSLCWEKLLWEERKPEWKQMSFL